MDHHDEVEPGVQPRGWHPETFRFVEPPTGAAASGEADHLWLTRLTGDLQHLNLVEHAAELDLKGYTVIPPETAAPSGFNQRLHQAIVDLATRRLGEPPDLLTGGNLCGSNGRGSNFGFAVLEEPVFQEALMNPVVLAMATCLLGYSCNLWLSAAAIKPSDHTALTIHADNPPWQPDPWPSYAQVCNVTYAVTDYTIEDGCICFVAGSHRLGRRPTPREARDYRNPALEPAIARAGSLIVFHGNTWHGAFPRRQAGSRLSLIMAFCRMYIEAQEDYRRVVTDEMVRKYPQRFATLMRLRDPSPYGPQGPEMRYGNAAPGGRTLYS